MKTMHTVTYSFCVHEPDTLCVHVKVHLFASNLLIPLYFKSVCIFFALIPTRFSPSNQPALISASSVCLSVCLLLFLNPNSSLLPHPFRQKCQMLLEVREHGNLFPSGCSTSAFLASPHACKAIKERQREAEWRGGGDGEGFGQRDRH